MLPGKRAWTLFTSAALWVRYFNVPILQMKAQIRERWSNLPKLTQLLSDSSGIQTKPSDCKDECFFPHCHDVRKTFWARHNTGMWWMVFLMPGALRLRWGVLQNGLHKETANQDSASCCAIFTYQIDLGLHLFSEDEAPGHWHITSIKAEGHIRYDILVPSLSRIRYPLYNESPKLCLFRSAISTCRAF